MCFTLTSVEHVASIIYNYILVHTYISPSILDGLIYVWECKQKDFELNIELNSSHTPHSSGGEIVFNIHFDNTFYSVTLEE